MTVLQPKRVVRLESDAARTPSPKTGRAAVRAALALGCASLTLTVPLSAYATAMPAVSTSPAAPATGTRNGQNAGRHLEPGCGRKSACRDVIARRSR